jgi:hypothetical protein
MTFILNILDPSIISVELHHCKNFFYLVEQLLFLGYGSNFLLKQKMKITTNLQM